MVELEQSSTNPTLPSESDENTIHVSFVSSDFSGQVGIPLMVPPTSPEVISFDWNSLVEPHLPSYVPFHIIVKLLSSMIHQTILDEGAYISILSSMTWKDIGSPNLLPTPSQLLAFNRSASEPLGILP